MRKIFLITSALFLLAMATTAQERKIQYKPYIDLRPTTWGHRPSHSKTERQR